MPRSTFFEIPSPKNIFRVTILQKKQIASTYQFPFKTLYVKLFMLMVRTPVLRIMYAGTFLLSANTVLSRIGQTVGQTVIRPGSRTDKQLYGWSDNRRSDGRPNV